VIASSPEPHSPPAAEGAPRPPSPVAGAFVSRPGAPIGVYIDPWTGAVRTPAAGAPMVLRAGSARSWAGTAFGFFLLLAAAWLSVFSTIHWEVSFPSAEVLIALLVGAAVNIELGRAVEGAGGSRRGPHRGLVAWPFAAALLLPPGVAGVVAAVAYTHAMLRGGRIPWQRAVFSWAVVTLAATTAGIWRQRLLPGPAPWTGMGQAAPVLLSAVGAFLAVELGVIAAGARLSPPDYAGFLHRWLAGPQLALTEAGILGTGALTAVLCGYWPGFVLLLLPVYALMQRALLHPSVRHAARHDSKTGLLTCESWYRSAESALARFRRERSEAALLLIDLDHFKRINDRHGHLVGDRVLALVARQLLELTRGADLVGRFGGEEFCLLLGAGGEVARRTAERLRAAIAAAHVPGVETPVTASIGIALFDGQSSLADLLNRADESLYTAKRTGRDRVGPAALVGDGAGMGAAP
jgi:diguanylate cyclase (GGDEF)-like protein